MQTRGGSGQAAGSQQRGRLKSTWGQTWALPDDEHDEFEIRVRHPAVVRFVGAAKYHALSLLKLAVSGVAGQLSPKSVLVKRGRPPSRVVDEFGHRPAPRCGDVDEVTRSGNNAGIQLEPQPRARSRQEV